MAFSFHFFFLVSILHLLGSIFSYYTLSFKYFYFLFFYHLCLPNDTVLHAFWLLLSMCILAKATHIHIFFFHWGMQVVHASIMRQLNEQKEFSRKSFWRLLVGLWHLYVWRWSAVKRFREDSASATLLWIKQWHKS